MIPHRPRRITSAEEVLKVLLFLERVHAGPIAVMRVGHQLAFVNEALKRLFNQLFPIVQVVENFLPQDHVPTVDSCTGLGNVRDAIHHSVRAGVDEMEARPWLHTHKAGDIRAPFKRFDDPWEWGIRKTIAVVGQEHRFAP